MEPQQACTRVEMPGLPGGAQVVVVGIWGQGALSWRGRCDCGTGVSGPGAWEPLSPPLGDASNMGGPRCCSARVPHPALGVVSGVPLAPGHVSPLI